MTKPFKQHIFLLLVVLAGCSSLANAKNNILSQLMTDNLNNGDVPLEDYDAATGTVRDKQPRDNSCDGQLTRDLIRTTERLSKTQKSLEEESSKHKLALETIVDLQKSLAKTNSDFVNEKEAKLELQATMDKTIEKAVKQTKKEMEDLKTKSTDDLEALREEKDNLIAALKEESASALESLRETAHKEFQQLKSESDEMILSLESKLKMSTDELQETMKLELEKAKKDKENLVSQISAEKQATIEKMTLAMDKANKESSALLEKATKESEIAVATLQAEREKQVESLQTLMEKERSEKSAEIQSLQDMKGKLKQIIATHERALEAAQSEISEWKTLHASRSYCNMTHVGADVYDAGAAAVGQVAGKATEVYGQVAGKAKEVYGQSLEYSSRVINEKYEEHWPSVAPYYDDIIIGNYQKLERQYQEIQPHLEAHIYPHVRTASAWTNDVAKPKVLEAIDDAKKVVSPVIEEKYNGAAKLYADYCKYSLIEFVRATQEIELFKDHPPPDFLLGSWETSCQNPHDSIKALMQGVGLLFAIIFYRRLLRLAWSILVFVLLIPVKLSPLRFFLPRKSTVTSKEIDSPPSSPSPMAQEASSESLEKVVADAEDEGDIDEDEGEGDASLY